MRLRITKIFNFKGHTRLRIGRILAEMVNPKNTSRALNDAPDSEKTLLRQSIRNGMNIIGVTDPILTLVPTSASMPRVVVTLPPVTSAPTSHMPSTTVFGDPNPHMSQVLLCL